MEEISMLNHGKDKEWGGRGRAPLTASDLRLGMKLYLKRASGVKLIQELEAAGVIVPHQASSSDAEGGWPEGTAGGTARENLAARLAWEVIRVEPFKWSVVGFDPKPAYRVQFRVEGARVFRVEEYFINNEVGYSAM